MPEPRIKPIVFTWDGERMIPLSRFQSLCQKQFTAGHRYTLAPGRSQISHDHFFACVDKAWQNWPEDYPRPLASADHLRKHALIQTGHYEQSVGHFGTNEKAVEHVRMFLRHVDYAEYSIAEDVAVVRVAKTQKKAAMNASEFQQSKEDVLGFLSSVLRIDVTTLSSEAKRDAA